MYHGPRRVKVCGTQAGRGRKQHGEGKTSRATRPELDHPPSSRPPAIKSTTRHQVDHPPSSRPPAINVTGQAEQTLEGHSRWITSAAFSPDGSRLLRHTRKFKATDPRDKLFALYGLASEQFPVNKDVFKPDYHMIASEVFRDVTAKLIEVAEDLDVLSYAGTPSTGVTDLPSWVPDWAVETELDILGTGSGESGYRACLGRDLPREIRISADHRTLDISGAFVDQISWNSVAFTQHFSDMLAEFRSPGFLRKIGQEEVQILGPNYAGGGTTVEAFWKTLIANIGEEREPATDHYFVHFLSYWRLPRLRDYLADRIIRDGGICPSFDDVNARPTEKLKLPQISTV